ncbi:restriction endonuclease [Streptomyces sp. NBC_01237]|uniref:restriction endonuclease n=1 Tax=Streptomyces sp. NBC_01237 TaxID=2903790 RepID=UPI002DD9691D|nr:restriction endonuclease [Streptomyces sp. NBC_01237]WRZ76626.1 restriction endonuclease [Streptomyces sp. NBC_01237]
MSDTHLLLHDPLGLIEAELPLDRVPYEALVTAVLAWKDPDLEPRDYEQIALQLTGHARAVASDVRRHAAALPKSDGRSALAELILREADGRLSAPLKRTARCAQNRARLVRSLYTRLDRLTEPAPAAT